VLDAHTGAPCKADKAHLTAALDFKPSSKAPEESVRCLLLIVGAKGARCLADFWNERVARVEWDHKVGNVVHAQVVERNGITSFDFMNFASDRVCFQDPTHWSCLQTGTMASCILSRCWNTCTRYHYPLPHPCKLTRSRQSFLLIETRRFA
jgi:hypothetical protein